MLMAARELAGTKAKHGMRSPVLSRIRNQSATARPPMMPTSVPSTPIEWDRSAMRTSCGESLLYDSGGNAGGAQAGGPSAARGPRRVRRGLVALLGVGRQTRVASQEIAAQDGHRGQAAPDHGPEPDPLSGGRRHHVDEPGEKTEGHHESDPEAHPESQIAAG